MKMQTAEVWTCPPFIKSGQNHLARHGETEKKTRQKKRLEDNIREWIGLEFVKSQRAVGNRETWKRQLVKSSVMLQRPPRRGDR